MAKIDREELIQKIPREQQDLLESLLEKRDQLVDQIKNLSAASLNQNRQAGEELADVGGDNFMQEMELSLVGEEEKMYYLIEEALERMQNGEYGICNDCGDKIPRGRLEAIPYAKLCVGCKEKREENEGMPQGQDYQDAEELVE